MPQLDMEMALAEVQIASPDLASFLIWSAQAGDEDDPESEEQFVTLLNFVYSYAREKNAESAEQTHAAAEG